MPKALATVAGQTLKNTLDHLKGKGAGKDAVRLLESCGLPQTNYSNMENPFVKHKDVAGNTGEG